MRHWKSSLLSFLTGFGIGLALFLIVGFAVGLLKPHQQSVAHGEPSAQHPCGVADSFSSPEEILAALKSEDVLVRREVFQKLFLRPGFSTTYYDYERDRDYPERAERAELKYLNLDDQSADEAVITFVRYEKPVALILKNGECGWWLAGALSSWLRFEDYPYQGWLELPETVKKGVHDILVRESTGDATRYLSNIRILRLMDGALAEVAEFTEEEIKPVEGYRGANWSDVKQRDTTSYSFLPETDGRAGDARLRLNTKEEMIVYAGAIPSNTFWMETDGAWHTSRKQWRERANVSLRLLGEHTRELIWNDERKIFTESQ